MEIQHALFFAILPDPDAAERIEEETRRLSDEYGLAGWKTPVERLHITLYGLGDATVVKKKQAYRAGETLYGMRAFDVSFDRLQRFHDKIVLTCSDTAPINDLNTKLFEAMETVGLPHPAHPSTPHISLVHDDRTQHHLFLDTPVTWRVTEFTLVHSHQGAGRHDYEHWPLVR